MRKVQNLEAPCEAFRKPARDEQRRRTGEHHLERNALARVLVPKSLHRFGPGGDLLDLVEREHRSRAPGFLREQSCRLPLLRDPLRVPERRLVGARDAMCENSALEHLPDQGSLAHLPGAGHHLNEAPRLGEPARKHGGLQAAIGGRTFTHDVEYFYSVL